MYCAVDEAFNNSLKKQLSEYDEKTNKKRENNNINKLNETNFPHSFDNYSDIEIVKKSYLNNENGYYTKNQVRNEERINHEVDEENISPAFFNRILALVVGRY